MPTSESRRQLGHVGSERGRYGAFLLTGSQPLGLMKSVSDSLAGRAAVIELEPLSFAEARADWV